MAKRFLCCLLVLFGIITQLFAGGTEEKTVETEMHGFDWKAFSGTEIKVMANKHPWVDLITPLLGEFEELTGISIELAVYPEDQYRTKRTVEMVSGTSDIDAFMIMPGQALAKYTQSGWLYPLNDFMSSENYLWPEYDPDDLFESSLNAATKDGNIYSVPIQLETSLLAYNKNILEQYGVAVPETMEELEAACRKIYEESGGEIYGITLRGKKASATSQWVDFLHTFGGEWLNQDGTAGVDSPEAIEATDFYGKLLRLYGPKSAPSNSWYESTSIFVQGKAAFIYDASVFKSIYEDAEKSSIADVVGYAVIPEGPAGSIPHISTWGLAIYSGSQDKGAAWLFMQWATSKEMALNGLLQGIPSARNSAWEDPAFSSTDNSPEWTNASIESYKLASGIWNPPVISVSECRDAMGSAIVASILGEDVEIACEDAAEAMDEIIETTH
jgi:multiple sugar transport system substrate-binding protein